MPLASYGGNYLHSDLYEMAAAYVFHIVENHPFVDGNKRTGIVSALVFLELNEFEVEADENSLETMVRAVSKGQMKKAAIADFFREHVRE